MNLFLYLRVNVLLALPPNELEQVGPVGSQHLLEVFICFVDLIFCVTFTHLLVLVALGVDVLDDLFSYRI